MERRNRGIESIQDIEDDAGPVFKCSRLAGAGYQVQYSGYKLTVTTPRSFEVTKLR